MDEIHIAPTLDSDGWELESAVERHHIHPTFAIPSEDERTNLRVGDRAKLLFLLVGQDAQGRYVQCERMWVHIEQSANMIYTGTLDSAPVTSEVLQPGDRILFGPEHVAAIYIRGTDARHPDNPSMQSKT